MYWLDQVCQKNKSSNFNIFFNNGIYFRNLFKISYKKSFINFPTIPLPIFSKKHAHCKKNFGKEKITELFFLKKLFLSLKTKNLFNGIDKNCLSPEKFLNYKITFKLKKNFKNKKFWRLFYIDLSVSIFFIKKEIIFLLNHSFSRALKFLKTVS